ncbi:hypothetical protein OIU85_003030 [Salix viminalis]|uniref:Uncharacterized protein n=1 Tax=Salix viminalis TaxID=40686 RepID=A0A9Q0PYV2_SALVM|nr:hypothetical protein OIU85_003030 [Salix viminalis]
MVDFIADYYKNIETYISGSSLRFNLDISIPASLEPPGTDPNPVDAILKDIQNHMIPGMTHWLSPNFFAFFPATVNIAGFLGEILCTCFNSDGFNWLAPPAATELEMIVVMDWLANMLKLPRTFMFSGSGGGRCHSKYNKRSCSCYSRGSKGQIRTVLEADVAADVANDFGLWVHVDAAYGGSSCICPEFRHHFNGIERVDSLILSPHKWLLTWQKCARSS